MLNKNGIPSYEQIISKFPQPELIKPKAIIECYEEIPCNPCSTSCPVNAITIGEDINQIPKIDYELCTGCGICVYSCPGLAIMVAQSNEDEAKFKIPYEFIPLPDKGEIWDAVNRKGEVIGKATIERVINHPRQDRTAVIEVSVDRKYLYDFSTIRRKR